MKNPSSIVSRLCEERGGVAVSFILVFPIFLTVAAIIVQYALLANAKAVLDHATSTAARSAMTALPDEQPDAVQRAAAFSLVPISPRSPDVLSEAEDLQTALQAVSDIPLTDSFAARYSYALPATTINYIDRRIDPSDPNRYWIEVEYRLLLTVPLARNMYSPSAETVAGVYGHFYSIGSQHELVVSPARWENRYHQGRPSERPN